MIFEEMYLSMLSASPNINSIKDIFFKVFPADSVNGFPSAIGVKRLFNILIMQPKYKVYRIALISPMIKIGFVWSIETQLLIIILYGPMKILC